MDDDQRVDAAFRRHPGGDDGFDEGGRGGEDADVVGEQLRDRFSLLEAQFTVEGDVNRRAGATLVDDV
ncbi:MAG: hypothetical protein LBJ46_05565 [Planctomycetota bacterium]|jgi:hypothetical protein|nr:hypothetical protein [Planctomycetota bacterium]